MNSGETIFDAKQTVRSDDGVNYDESLVFLVLRSNMMQLSEYFRRDARRYDNGYKIY